MVDPLNAAALALSGDMARIAGISRNLVNAATPGYRRELSFAALVEQEGRTPMAAATGVTDQRKGTLRTTGAPHDLAIDGDGFFEAATNEGMVYTRRGDFRLDAQGRLVTVQGHVLQGLGGAIQTVGEAPIEVDREGVVMQGEQRLGQVKVATFERPERLTRLPGGLFKAGEAPQAALAGSYRIRQGALEASNVDTAAEMVQLMETMRHFEATQKLVQSVDDMRERALRKLGEF